MTWSATDDVVRPIEISSRCSRAVKRFVLGLLIILAAAIPGPAAFGAPMRDPGVEAIRRTGPHAPTEIRESRTLAAAGTAYYVAMGGSDSNDGLTPTTAWATMQKAADTLVPGETVLVLPGDYTNLKVIVRRSGVDGAPIVFQAQGTVTTPGFIVTADYITIKGFDVSDPNDHRVNGSPTHDSRGGTGILVTGSFCNIEDNYVHFSVWGGIRLYKSGDTSAPSHCVVRNNRLFKNGMQGLEVYGRSNVIEGNEIWGTIQHHPNNVEHASETWLDADGMRFFGQGHVVRKNYIHDIKFGPPGVNPDHDDYNDDPHIDCFQTWTDSYHETAKDILFEGNWCDNAQGQASNETGQGFMIEGPPPNSPSGLIVRNNVIRAYRCMNVLDAAGMVIVNNTCVNDPSLPTTFHPSGVGLENSPGATIKNNLFYDMTVHTIILRDTVSQTAETGRNLTYRSDGKPLVINESYYGASRRANDLWGIDPLLRDPHAQSPDYHLTLGSPAIDAGYGLGGMVPDDYDGIARPQLNGFDIGAFEYAEPGSIFADVPMHHPYRAEIEWLYQNGYTAGCNTDPLMYCPEATMNRAESSVFVERGIHTAAYDPPAPTSQVFADMPLDSWAAKWVTGLWNDQYTAGCGTDPLIYCPWQGHTRAEGCVFYLRMLKGATYEPAQPAQQTFVDVPLEAWYAKWVQTAFDAGLITACQMAPDLRFCPDGPLTRALAAHMMVQAKGLNR